MSQPGRAVNAAGELEGYEVFLKFLPADATEAALKTFFADAGKIVGEPRLMMDPRTNKCKGIGWITFATVGALNEALSWDGCTFGGRRLSVTAAKAVHTGIRPSVQAPGTHTPALIEKVIEKMVGRETGGVYVDGTFGRGGHTRGILDALSPAGRLHAFDMDPEAIKVGKELMAADSRFTIHHAPFSTMDSVLRGLGVRPAGIFFDLGISSPQFDEAHRGFRPEADGPLDLRFDQTKGVPAHEWLQTAPREEIARVLHDYGETTDATASRRIADAICLVRASRRGLPKRTREFASLVAAAKGVEYQPMHPAKLAFQALRIHLNDEFGEMRNGMRAAFELLPPGGRIGLITWKHSECAIVVRGGHLRLGTAGPFRLGTAGTLTHEWTRVRSTSSAGTRPCATRRRCWAGTARSPARARCRPRAPRSRWTRRRGRRTASCRPTRARAPPCCTSCARASCRG